MTPVNVGSIKWSEKAHPERQSLGHPVDMSCLYPPPILSGVMAWIVETSTELNELILLDAGERKRKRQSLSGSQSGVPKWANR